jgi:hypothetical protein
MDVGSLRRRRQISDRHALNHAPAQKAQSGHLKISRLRVGLVGEPKNIGIRILASKVRVHFFQVRASQRDKCFGSVPLEELSTRTTKARFLLHVLGGN